MITWIGIFATIKLIFFSFGVDVWSYNEENDTTCDTHLSQVNCALDCMTCLFVAIIGEIHSSKLFFGNTAIQTFSVTVPVIHSIHCMLIQQTGKPGWKLNLVFSLKNRTIVINLVTLNYLKVIHFRHVSTMMIYHHHDRSFKYYSSAKATERLWKVWS